MKLRSFVPVECAMLYCQSKAPSHQFDTWIHNIDSLNDNLNLAAANELVEVAGLFFGKAATIAAVRRKPK